MQKTIMKSVFITLGSLLSAVGLLALFLGIFSPVTMARFFEGINGNISLYFYKSSYEKSKDIGDLYLVVNKSIQFNNELSVVEYYPRLLREERYDKFMGFVDENNTKEGTILQKVMLSNEDNRLKSRYVRALVKLNMAEDAFRFAINDLSDSDNFIISAIAEFVDAATLSESDYNAIYERFESFESRYSAAVTDFEKAKLSRRALEAAQFLIFTYNYIDAGGFMFASKAELEQKRDNFNSIFNVLID